MLRKTQVAAFFCAVFFSQAVPSAFCANTRTRPSLITAAATKAGTLNALGAHVEMLDFHRITQLAPGLLHRLLPPARPDDMLAIRMLSGMLTVDAEARSQKRNLRPDSAVYRDLKDLIIRDQIEGIPSKLKRALAMDTPSQTRLGKALDPVDETVGSIMLTGNAESALRRLFFGTSDRPYVVMTLTYGQQLADVVRLARHQMARSLSDDERNRQPLLREPAHLFLKSDLEEAESRLAAQAREAGVPIVGAHVDIEDFERLQGRYNPVTIQRIRGRLAELRSFEKLQREGDLSAINREIFNRDLNAIGEIDAETISRAYVEVASGNILKSDRKRSQLETIVMRAKDDRNGFIMYYEPQKIKFMDEFSRLIDWLSKRLDMAIQIREIPWQYAGAS